MGLFVDLIKLGERETNDALEQLCKSTHDHDSDIWLPMDSPLLARLVELFTQRGLTRLDAVRVELLAWSLGAQYRAGERIARPAGAMERWSRAELSLVRIYLEHLPPAEWTLDDHMMAVDYVVQRYLPADDIRSEAEWLASRANLMGRVQAAMGEPKPEQADAALMAAASQPTPATVVERAVLEFATQRCAENVRRLADDVRHRMRTTIADHVHSTQMGVPPTGGASLESKLLDQFATLNRDWRRIAVTEAGEAQTQGYVATLAAGTRLKRVEQYRNACAFCRSINGRVVTVVDPAKSEKNWDTEIWPGKSNIGRSASPRKRVGAVFKEREPEEMWTIPAGLVHPHCRGRWVAVNSGGGGDPEFAAWLRTALAPKPEPEEKM